MQKHETSLPLRSWCIPVMIGATFCKQHREGDLSRVLDPTGSSSPVPSPILWRSLRVETTLGMQPAHSLKGLVHRDVVCGVLVTGVKRS